MGRKGLSSGEPGFIFAPYIPMSENPCVVFHDTRDGRLIAKDRTRNVSI